MAFTRPQDNVDQHKIDSEATIETQTSDCRSDTVYIPKRIGQRYKRPIAFLEHDKEDSKSNCGACETDNEDHLIGNKRSCHGMNDMFIDSPTGTPTRTPTGTPTGSTSISNLATHIDLSKFPCTSSSNSISISGTSYSFDNPEISLMEFEQDTGIEEQSNITSPMVKPAATATQTNIAPTTADTSDNAPEMNAFKKWLAECVEILAD